MPKRTLEMIRPIQAREGSTPWQGVDPEALYRCVCSVSARGDALLLGTTSDGGAMTLLVMSGSDKKRFYEPDQAEMNLLLVAIADWAENT